MKKFDDLGLSAPIQKAVAAEGYTNPTPIQEKAIPTLLSGKDLIGIAQTGTGKTASFVLPLLNQIAEARHKRAPKSCRALILSPTRELAAQIVDNVKTYSKFTDTTVTLVVGGVRPGNQVKALRGGVDIVVATPGRLLDHISTGAISLRTTHSIVVDEADQMLDLGFLPDIRRIMKVLPKKRQTALLSATMPTQIRKLANDLLNSPVEIKVAAVSRPVERIDQSVRHVAKEDKRRLLTEILMNETVERAVVFTRTKRGADRVSKHLNAAGLRSLAIHGNKSQNQRNRAITAFRSGDMPILVATDIAARGIDIDDVSHVVNYELPNVPEAYVHRIGRTARAGKSGVAISLCDPSERSLLKDIEKLIGDKLQSNSEGEIGAEASPSDRSDEPPRGNRTKKKKNAQAPKSKRNSRRQNNRPAHARNSGNPKRKRARSGASASKSAA